MKCLWIVTLIGWSCLTFASTELDVVFGMDSNKRHDALAQYRINLIKLALDEYGAPYQFRIYQASMNQGRRLQFLSEGKQFNVAIQGTSKSFEETFLPVRIPIYLGLGSAYRLMLIRNELSPALSKVNTLDDLRKFSVGQGTSWSDIAIWENAGFKVLESSYKNLFAMTAAGRFDLFSRGLFEAFEEQQIYARQYPNLIVDPHLLVVYPFAIYIFVSPQHPQIQKALYSGLEKAYRNGKMKKLLLSNEAVTKALAQANLKSRTRIDLPAYQMTPETLQAIKTYAFEEE